VAVNPADPYYRAETVPPSIKTLGAHLCAFYAVGVDNFGDRGNLAHVDGYHRSRRYNQVHAPGNYSVQLALDKAGDGNTIRAFDITPGVWGSADNRAKMMQMTRRMRVAAKAHDPRIRTLREFAGTEDGVHVVTIDMQTGADRTPFDASHLDHGHGSIFTAYAAEDHTGIFEVLTGTAVLSTEEDEPMANTWTQPLTQGTPGYAGQQRDTALAFTWQASNEAAQGVSKLLAAAEADEVRDKAALAAIQALATAGGVDGAPIVAAVNAVRDEARARFAELATAVHDAEMRATAAELARDELERELAAAYAKAAGGPAQTPGSGSG